jgi:hypothetical protein
VPTPSQPDGREHADTHGLTQTELHRLTLFKWRYSLKSLGFTPREVSKLMFLTWLHASARVRG